MLIKIQIIVASLYERLTVSFLVIFLALVMGCATPATPRIVMSYDQRAGVYYEQIAKLASSWPGLGVDWLMKRPKEGERFGEIYIVSKVQQNLFAVDVWVVPVPGYKWANPEKGDDSTIIPANLSK